VKSVLAPQEQYFLDLLKIADRSSMASLVRALLDPMALDNFVAD